jgi:hypothetical protein
MWRMWRRLRVEWSAVAVLVLERFEIEIDSSLLIGNRKARVAADVI